MQRVKRRGDRKSTRLNSSHITISYAVFCLKKKNIRGCIKSSPPGARAPSTRPPTRAPTRTLTWPCGWFFFFNDTATTEIYTLSLHDALPIFARQRVATASALVRALRNGRPAGRGHRARPTQQSLSLPGPARRAQTRAVHVSARALEGPVPGRLRGAPV